MMRRWIALWLAVCAGAALSAEPAAPGEAARGQVIYETGRRTDGSALPAHRPGAGAVPAASAACANCHRGSGMGQREGKLLVPVVAGHILFAPLHRSTMLRAHPAMVQQPLRAYDRPAYTARALATAVRDGIDVAGRPLDPAMPRYQLSARDAADLEAYLRQLGSQPLAGVSNGVLHLASVLTPDAQPEARRTVAAATAAWAAQLSLGGWRVKWSPWVLEGPPQGWAAQLDKRWQDQPVFAMVSGAGGTHWAPVARFCEARRLPCVFPSIELPPEATDEAHFNFYLSEGIRAEAALLAQWHAQLPAPPRGVLQLVAAGDEAATAGAAQLQRALPTGLAQSPTPVAAGDTAALAAAYRTAREGDVVVLWARAAAVSDFLRQTPPRPGVALWLSAMVSPEHRVEVPAAWRSQVLWASVHADMVRRNAGAAMSMVPWARSLNLPADLDPVVLSEVHAATFFFTDTLARMREGLNTAYFNETLEDTVDLRPASSGFFRMSLGPNQRIAARGGHMLGFRSQRSPYPVPVSPYLRAEAADSPR